MGFRNFLKGASESLEKFFSPSAVRIAVTAALTTGVMIAGNEAKASQDPIVESGHKDQKPPTGVTFGAIGAGQGTPLSIPSAIKMSTDASTKAQVANLLTPSTSPRGVVKLGEAKLVEVSSDDLEDLTDEVVPLDEADKPEVKENTGDTDDAFAGVDMDSLFDDKTTIGHFAATAEPEFPITIPPTLSPPVIPSTQGMAKEYLLGLGMMGAVGAAAAGVAALRRKREEEEWERIVEIDSYEQAQLEATEATWECFFNAEEEESSTGVDRVRKSSLRNARGWTRFDLEGKGREDRALLELANEMTGEVLENYERLLKPTIQKLLEELDYLKQTNNGLLKAIEKTCPTASLEIPAMYLNRNSIPVSKNSLLQLSDDEVISQLKNRIDFEKDREEALENLAEKLLLEKKSEPIQVHKIAGGNTGKIIPFQPKSEIVLPEVYTTMLEIIRKNNEALFRGDVEERGQRHDQASAAE